MSGSSIFMRVPRSLSCSARVGSSHTTEPRFFFPDGCLRIPLGGASESAISKPVAFGAPKLAAARLAGRAQGAVCQPRPGAAQAGDRRA